MPRLPRVAPAGYAQHIVQRGNSSSAERERPLAHSGRPGAGCSRASALQQGFQLGPDVFEHERLGACRRMYAIGLEQLALVGKAIEQKRH